MYSVILVDDEYWALQSNKKVFRWEEHGFQVIGETTDSEEAIELIRENNPDVVFLDINMPGISGLELIETIKTPKIIKYIIISAHRNFEYAQKAIILNAFEYLVKPVRDYDAERLLTRLKKTLDEERNIIDIEDLLLEYNFENKNISNPCFKRMLKYIIENSDKKLNLTVLAEQFELNPNYCSSLFSRHFKCGFSEFITQIRILNAANMLKTTEDRIETIALKNGYSDYGYFNKVFKKILGITPNDFRKKNKDNLK